MRKHTHMFGLFFVLFFLFSCEHIINNRAELIQYINNEENGLTSHKEVNKIMTSLTYTPWQLLLNEKNSRESEKYSNQYKLKDKLFFVLSLSYKNRELLKQLNYEQYSEMMQVLSFRMDEFVELIPDSGTPVHPVSCQLLQTFGLAKANSLVIAFEKNKLLSYNNLTLRINEFGLKTGDLNYIFNVKDVIKIPKIKL